MSQRREVAERAWVEFFRNAGFDPCLFEPVLEQAGFDSVAEGSDHNQVFRRVSEFSRVWPSSLGGFRGWEFEEAFGASSGVVLVFVTAIGTYLHRRSNYFR